MNNKEIAQKAIAIKALEEKMRPQRSSLIEYVKYHWLEEKGEEWADNWHYHVMSDILEKVIEGKIKRVIFSVPPGSGKTELITKHFPVYCLGKNPKEMIIASSYSAEKAARYGKTAREYYQDTATKRVFPRMSPLKKDQNAKGLWENEAGGQYMSTGTSGITGERATKFIIDDPLSMSDINSPTEVQKVNTWWEETVSSRLKPNVNSAFIIIHQRYGTNDLTAKLLKDMAENDGNEWVHVVLPAEKEYAEAPYKEMYEDDVLQPNMFPMSDLIEKRKDMGAFNYGCQYLQRPTTPASQTFHGEHMRYIERKDQPATMAYGYCDPAFTKNTHSDYCAIGIGRAGEDDEVVLIDGKIKKMETPEVAESILNFIQKWGIKFFRIEKNGAESLKTVLEIGLRERKLYCELNFFHNSADKTGHILSLQPEFEQGKIKFVEGMECLPELEKQLIEFRVGGTMHDDAPDMLAGLVKTVREKYGFSGTRAKWDMPEQSFDASGMPVFR